ncbi:hypothetical protein [Serinicoccus marinus]|uniref:hypothetical protein n=1 Tax=Serinicoccus marinus TaxID=247333 RepID=UPI00248F7D9C|nr:hypothetical protein [Serinicoccus marinus]
MRCYRRALSIAVLLFATACSESEGQDHVLDTHCGIDELHVEGQWYERAQGPLDDGSGNPPDGWDNPEQMGTLTRVDETTLVFTDEVGHREEFVLRPGATEAKRACD